MTATRQKSTLHLALPPRLGMGMVRSDSGDSMPSTPGPHTPLPYDFAGFFNAPIETIPAEEPCMPIGVGSKRGREEEDEKRQEPSWTDDEIDVIQTTLIRPFRPISTHYPPGELPPPNVIDELTNQILNYAFRVRSPRGDTARSPSPDGWPHAWDATRKKLFETALAESNFGRDAEERKMTREERQHRPGLRRVDSMDYLDQAQDAKSADSIGKALRLSTSLQNSAKQDPILSLARSTSVGSGLISEPLPAAGPSSPPVAAITLTPASPTANPPLRRKSSFRASSSKPLRPTSLLQRGRSFTANDLKAEAEAEDEHLETLVSAPRPPPAVANGAARLTRSQSSSSTLHPPAHAARDLFLSTPKPSTTDRSVLAMPLPIESAPAPAPKASGWSDSEDEAVSQPRKIKKLKQGKKVKPAGGLRVPAGIGSNQIIAAGGLRSPFEEKEELRFE